jgi:succinate dehydrogenase / fumarate reductase cytochrome b subunit
MAGTERRARPRPLSPHLQIYKPQINMVMSILHRITGAAL